jgi:hypothetical protein
MAKPKLPKLIQTDSIDILLKEKGLVMNKMDSVPVYTETILDANGNPIKKEVVLLHDAKKIFKLAINTTDDYALKGTRRGTIFIQYQPHDSERFKQLSLIDVGMNPQGKKPIQEDMGKVLVKIFQDNLALKTNPPSLIAGLSKFLFYAFIFSIIVYVAMFAVNIYMTYAATNAFSAAQAALNHLVQLSSSPVP